MHKKIVWSVIWLLMKQINFQNKDLYILTNKLIYLPTELLH